MQAGGIGYGKLEQAIKKTPQTGDKIVILGGENYRIGMGGAAVSSADTGAFSSGIELNAIQRSNPEMQKSCQCHSWIGRKPNRIHSRSRSWRTFKLSVRISGRYRWIN
jgi:phosphoribosylformylglycinamidine (FGAM) synthase-like enzyme